MLDQKAMNKSRKFIYFKNGNNQSEFMTVAQAQTVFSTLDNLGMEIDNQTGLIF